MRCVPKQGRKAPLPFGARRPRRCKELPGAFAVCVRERKRGLNLSVRSGPAAAGHQTSGPAPAGLLLERRQTYPALAFNGVGLLSAPGDALATSRSASAVWRVRGQEASDPCRSAANRLLLTTPLTAWAT